MRVGVDGFNLAIPRGTGIATYARGLTRCLAELGHPVDMVYGLDVPARSDPVTLEVAFFDHMQSDAPGRQPKYPGLPWFKQMLAARRGFEATLVPISGRVMDRHLVDRMPHYDRILNVPWLFRVASHYYREFNRFVTIRVPDPPRIMHWTYPLPIRVEGAANIYTIHDLVPLLLPHTTLDKKPLHIRLLRDCFRQGAHICTVSDRSRQDILNFFPELPPEKVTNTYQVVVPPRRTPDDAQVEHTVRGAFNLVPRGYFLFFGSLEPKKNIGRLLEAVLSAPPGMPLVLVGARAWKAEAELAVLASLPPDSPVVRQLDYVPAETLVTLIRGARAVAFPSLYEGFGLPLLEAMALGTPVLTSREGSLPEIGGDAVAYVDAYDPADIAAGLRRLVEDDALWERLRARGLERAKTFDMAHYKDRVQALYERVLAAG